MTLEEIYSRAAAVLTKIKNAVDDKTISGMLIQEHELQALLDYVVILESDLEIETKW